ncbi:MAG: DUF3237 domain-containing protein [Acidimicrobiia bacterium]|nr:DUF3237 domain-containing protein [Acidimicrobiia bacterium]
MTIELIPLATARITLAEPFILPATPSGTRIIAEVRSGEYEGERLRGSLKGVAAADWMTLSAEGVGTLDVRALLETHDGALVYSWYHGRTDFSEGPGVKPIYVAPLFESGDERYTWLNSIQAVAKGTLSENNTLLTYEICEVR